MPSKEKPALVIDHTTPDKPEVLGIAQRLGVSVGDAFTGCFRVWAWAKTHTKAGVIRGVDGREVIDRVTGVKGFAEAMMQVGWLELRKDGFAVPRFERHLALEAYRVESPPRGKPRKEPKPVAFPPSLDTPAFRQAWGRWEQFRKELRKPLTPSTVTLQLKQLARAGVDAAVRMIERSIEHGWRGLFPEDEDGPRPRRGVGRVDAPPGKYDGLAARCGPEAEPGAEAPPPPRRPEDPGDGPWLFGAKD